MGDLFTTGIRPAVDEFLLEKSKEQRDYGEYWSASSAGYCNRRVIFDRLKMPKVKDDARKHRVFEVGHIFHEWIQRITKEAGLSIAQELELQDEEHMIRGHIDDLVIIDDKLMLIDYKSVSSRSFSWAKKNGDVMSHYHKMQLGTYMYMLRKGHIGGTLTKKDEERYKLTKNLTEARILKISKDDLRMSEQQLMWSPALEKDVAQYWSTLNGYWKAKTLPKCTCADYEGGFLAKEAYNDYYFEKEPCSLKWAKQCHKEGKVDLAGWKLEK